MESEISIDIHIPKLLDWLISRKHINKDWQSQIIPIREKINCAIQDMPEHQQIIQLLTGTHINYYHCLEIVEILKETEKDTKNLFGRYGSQRMKDWLEISNLYQRDNVYLAEAASLLYRNVKYDIPGLKKQILKCKHIQSECKKKSVEYEKSAACVKKELEGLHLQFGITGTNVHLELLKKVSTLDDSYKIVENDVKSLRGAVEYYKIFSLSVASISFSLPLISFIIERGNATTFEWLYGEKPKRIEVPSLEICVQQNVIDTNEDINWDITNEETSPEENFQITLEESGIVVECQSVENSVAKNNEAYSVLDNPKTRDDFITQLMELQSFLKMRLFELKKDTDAISLSNEVQETGENIVRWMDCIEIIKRTLIDPFNQQLHSIKHSLKFANELTRMFERKKASVEKFLTCKKAVDARFVEFEQNEADLKPKLRSLVQKTKQLVHLIENDISSRYKGRPVNLIGF